MQLQVLHCLIDDLLLVGLLLLAKRILQVGNTLLSAQLLIAQSAKTNG